MTRSWPRARNVLRTRQGRILRPSSSPRSFSARQRYTYWMTSVGSGSVHELVKGDGFGARRGGPEASGCFITQFLGRDSDMVEARERSEEHTSELQSLMRNSYAVFCLKKKNKKKYYTQISTTATLQ